MEKQYRPHIRSRHPSHDILRRNHNKLPYLPFKSVTRNDGKMVIVNLQHTPKDKQVLRTGGMLIHAKIDDVMTYIMDRLGLEIPEVCAFIQHIN